MTNLIVLAVTLVTNSQPGDGVFRQFGDHIVGLKSVDYAQRLVSVGYLDGTNTVEAFTATKTLWAKTNWHDLPIVVGVASLPVQPAAQPSPLPISTNLPPNHRLIPTREQRSEPPK